MVAGSHGREGGQVMAYLLARLDIIAWNVCPEHKYIYFTKCPSISFRCDQQFHTGLWVTLNRSELYLDLTDVLFDMSTNSTS